MPQYDRRVTRSKSLGAMVDSELPHFPLVRVCQILRLQVFLHSTCGLNAFSMADATESQDSFHPHPSIQFSSC